MIVNILVLFMCINLSLGLLYIPGSPISISQSSCFYPEEAADGTARPGADPVNPDGIVYYMNGTAYVKTTDELGRELMYPTNSTQTAPGVWEGTGEWFGAITEPIERQYKALEVMMNMLTGGYIMDTFNHINLDCAMDNDPASPTYKQLVRMSTGYCTTPDPTSGQPQIDLGITQTDCENASGVWSGDGQNAMWDYIKGGMQAVIGFLIALTIFYWITGRGHILSS